MKHVRPLPHLSHWFTAKNLLRILIAFCFALGILRACVVLMHEPLLAYANSYDEVRYTACFDLYPERPAEIPPAENSPGAPFSRYTFITAGSQEPMCYWSSELVPQAIVVAAWKLSEALGGDKAHSVRALGALKFTLLLALSIALTAAWWRRGLVYRALVNAALLPVLFADPANTLYANTFYAEWTALTALYATTALILLFADQPPTRRRVILLACAGLALGAAKLQHMFLPVLLGVVIMLIDRLRGQAWQWRGVALAAGGVLALTVQIAQLNRADPLIENIRLANAADVVLTGLLPASDNPARTLARLNIDPACMAWSGRHAWELPNYDPEGACRGITQFSRAKEIGLLLKEPKTAVRFALNGIIEVDSWLAKNLGTIEGGVVDPLPPAIPSLGPILLGHLLLRLLLLLAPLLAFAVMLVRRHPHRAHVSIEFAGVAAATIASTWAVTVLGDGLADVAKQCHLVFNAALAWSVAAGIPMSANLASRALLYMPQAWSVQRLPHRPLTQAPAVRH